MSLEEKYLEATKELASSICRLADAIAYLASTQDPGRDEDEPAPGSHLGVR